MNHSDIIPSGWDQVEFIFPLFNSILHIPNNVIVSELIHPPAISRQLAFRILDQYDSDLQKKLYEEIYNVDGIEDDDKLWKKITKIITKHLQKTEVKQETKLLYIFFSLQRYRLPQESIDLDSMEHLKNFSNYIVASLKDVIDNPSEADKTMKKFLEASGDRQGYAWYLYHKLSFIYMQMILPIPLRSVDDINLEDSANYIGRKMFEKEIYKASCENKLEYLKEKKSNLVDLEKIREIDGEIRKLENEIDNVNLIYDNRELNKLGNKLDDAERKRLILFSEYYIHEQECNKISMMASEKCPEYITQCHDKGDENIKLRRSTRQSGLKIPKLCQCQICYRYRLQDISANGEYSGICHRPECRKKYDAWIAHINYYNIKFSEVYKNNT